MSIQSILNGKTNAQILVSTFSNNWKALHDDL